MLTIFLAGVVMVFIAYYFIRKQKHTQAQQAMSQEQEVGFVSDYPPGMQIDWVLKRWETDGMEEPFFGPVNCRDGR